MILFQPDSGPELVLSEEEQSDDEDKAEVEPGAVEDQRSVILHLISQLKLGMDLTKVGWCCLAAVSISVLPCSLFPRCGKEGTWTRERPAWAPRGDILELSGKDTRIPHTSPHTHIYTGAYTCMNSLLSHTQTYTNVQDT